MLASHVDRSSNNRSPADWKRSLGKWRHCERRRKRAIHLERQEPRHNLHLTLDGEETGQIKNMSHRPFLIDVVKSCSGETKGVEPRGQHKEQTSPLLLAVTFGHFRAIYVRRVCECGCNGPGVMRYGAKQHLAQLMAAFSPRRFCLLTNHNFIYRSLGLPVPDATRHKKKRKKRKLPPKQTSRFAFKCWPDKIFSQRQIHS
jgi:hypothetical protein